MLCGQAAVDSLHPHTSVVKIKYKASNLRYHTVVTPGVVGDVHLASLKVL